MAFLSPRYLTVPALDLRAPANAEVIGRALEAHFTALRMPMPRLSLHDSPITAMEEVLKVGEIAAKAWSLVAAPSSFHVQKLFSASADFTIADFTMSSAAGRGHDPRMQAAVLSVLRSGVWLWQYAQEYDVPGRTLPSELRWEQPDATRVLDTLWGLAVQATRLQAKDAWRIEAVTITWTPVESCLHAPGMLALREAGLWGMWILADRIVAVERPQIWTERIRQRRATVHSAEDTWRWRLHREDGPAVLSRSGIAEYFWHGVRVPAKHVMAPQTLIVDDVLREPNAEIARVALERYPVERFIQETGGQKLHTDSCGTLWQIDLRQSRMLGEFGVALYVEVLNRSPEPDGTFKTYFLPVHPQLRPLLADGQLGVPQSLTARNAVASTFGLRGDEYFPRRET